MLAAAGILDGQRTTIHPSAHEAPAQHATVTDQRVVQEDDVITSSGVTASIDLGLTLCELLADADTREQIAREMDYPHDHDYLTE